MFTAEWGETFVRNLERLLRERARPPARETLEQAVQRQRQQRIRHDIAMRGVGKLRG